MLTGLIWATEAMRLFLVVQALGFPDVQLGISGAFFVALIGSLLTAVPFTPGRARDRRDRRRRRPDPAYGVPPTEATRSRSSTG